MADEPKRRDKYVTDDGKGVHKRGEGLHTGGPVGRQDAYAGRGSSGGGTGKRAAIGGGGLAIIVAIISLLMKNGGGSTGTTTQPSSTGNTNAAVTSLLGFSGSNQVSTGWTSSANTAKLNTEVSSAARPKRTQILGNGKDTVTIMVYMCGTDLESKYGMATNDLTEMAKATIGSNVNVIICTGGCNKWKTEAISSSVNQLYQIKDGKLIRLSDNFGSKPMVDETNLESFIKWCASNYPANRNDLILWDHGGGSISGYGYDEKNRAAGSMDLSELNRALKNAGVTFDFIGFDACLMATLETALMTSNYADYLIASEETEPGVGWYYTNWLTALSQNTSMPTIEIGKKIVDDFVDVCAQTCKGQKTTLSVIDLAELSATIPDKLENFSEATVTMIKNQDYQKISNARSGTREFAQSSKIDQIDLVDFATRIGTAEAKSLADTLLNAVKYNRTSTNMTNAYGMSIYFPYKRTGSVNSMVKTYDNIGMDDSYGKCIKAFAGLETAGQISSGGSSSPLSSLFGSAGSSQTTGSDAISNLLNAFLGGGRSIPGVDRSTASYMEEDTFDASAASSYIAGHQLDASSLVWTKTDDGHYALNLTKDQWGLVESLQVNMFYDDGGGYVDLGLDSYYECTADGRLKGDIDHTWISIEGQPVAYYYENEIMSGDTSVITGRVPVLINGERANLILNMEGKNYYIAGARFDYTDNETETVAKNVAGKPIANTKIKLSDGTEVTIAGEEIQTLHEGDKIDFLCDYYSYDQKFQDSYFLGEQLTYSENWKISYTVVDKTEGKVVLTYLLTDLYQHEYWTPQVPEKE